VAVVKSAGRLEAADGTLIGEGRAYVHVRQGADVAQPAEGTFSLDWWENDAPAPARLVLESGPTLEITVASDKLAACMVGRILRYQTAWPGQ
jgi:hypothetical protein